MMLEESGAPESSCVSNIPSFGAVLGCDTEVACGAVKENTVTELGGNPGLGVS
jgi:hypothetical protein